ncbi:hypothetical protein [Dyadobacter subterraneus]|nr:hypothetical protein [Dyadobacter subterraneus]
MDGISYLIELLEDIEDEIAIDLRKDEERLNWDDVREELMRKD